MPRLRPALKATGKRNQHIVRRAAKHSVSFTRADARSCRLDAPSRTMHFPLGVVAVVGRCCGVGVPTRGGGSGGVPPAPGPPAAALPAAGGGGGRPARPCGCRPFPRLLASDGSAVACWAAALAERKAGSQEGGWACGPTA